MEHEDTRGTPVRLDDVRRLAGVAEREGLLDGLGPLWRRCPEPLASLAPAGSAPTARFDWFWPALAHFAGRAASDAECALALAILDRLFRPSILEAAAQRAFRRLPGVPAVVETLAEVTGAADYAIHLVHLLTAANRPADVNRVIGRRVSDGTLAVSELIEPQDLDGVAWLAPASGLRASLPVPTVTATGHEVVGRRLLWPSGRPYLAELRDAVLEADILVHVGDAGALAAGISYRRRYGLPYRSVVLSPKQPLAVHAPLGDDVPILDQATYLGRPAEHGHFIIECLERLYAHAMARRPPKAPILVRSLPRAGYRQLLTGLGLPADDDGYAVMPGNRVRCRRLTLAGIGTQLPAVDPDTVRFLGDRGRHAAGVPAGRPGPGRRLYLARPATARRSIVNEGAVRDELERCGYETVHLEELDLADQIALVAEASEVVGVHGSAMINLVWARPGTRVCVLAPASWRTWAPGHIDMLFGLLEAAGLDATLVEGEHQGTDDRAVLQFHADLDVPLAALRRWLGHPRHG